jgi:hypothetical protein
MDFIDRLKDLGDRVLKMKEQVQTEEATKNAFVMPFISALGYDVFNPTEVVPEFTADLGTKKGEKVDYCILKDGKPIIIIECKHWKEPLDVHKSQLHRYFHVTAAKFGILTNGIVYRLYTDLEEANKMDDKPFLELSLESINEGLANELKKFHRDKYDAENIVSTASDLKYSKEIRTLLANEMREPSDEFVKFFASRVYSGRITQKVVEQFKDLVARSAKQLLSEMINERLQNALNTETQIAAVAMPTAVAAESPAEEDTKKGVQTTEEERDAFLILKAILRKVVPISRISERDTKSYFGVLLDDNNRKPICRLHFNSSNKYIGTFDADKNETKHLISSLDDIYQYEELLIASASRYLSEE